MRSRLLVLAFLLGCGAETTESSATATDQTCVFDTGSRFDNCIFAP